MDVGTLIKGTTIGDARPGQAAVLCHGVVGGGIDGCSSSKTSTHCTRVRLQHWSVAAARQNFTWRNLIVWCVLGGKQEGPGKVLGRVVNINFKSQHG